MFKRMLKLFQLLKPEIPKKNYALMIVPHNQKSIKNYKVSSKLIYIIFSVFIFTMLFSIMSISRYIYLTFREKSIKSENEEMIKKIENLVYNSNKIIKSQKNFSEVFNSLLANMGLSDQIFYSESNSLGGPFVELNNESEKKDEEIFKEIEEIKDLKMIENKINSIDKAIKKVVNRVKNYEKITRYIPSIWPLIGEGEIVSKGNGTIKIESIPYTPVIATAKGRVVKIDIENNLLKIVLKHNYNFITTYSNIYNIPEEIKEGYIVEKGDIIGYTGKNRGEGCLEYGIYIGNENGINPVDPESFSYLGRR
ncbi:MAG TPA: M23 family metallopeptidase [Spirochaetota bacterium]|nr:M23 family metallopeptidase [Spirochaetota bacterium]HOM38368.1 M23 family metallopeptidase [Spirochaetota bacterium]HPQ48414.1 M23 family metallopeptidase [Spirochaetota bacterium]